jgi:hypothetical protein
MKSIDIRIPVYNRRSASPLTTFRSLPQAWLAAAKLAEITRIWIRAIAKASAVRQPDSVQPARPGGERVITRAGANESEGWGGAVAGRAV